jgi:integrase
MKRTKDKGRIANKKLGQPHPQKALSALRIRSLQVAGRYADGNGLYLVVDPSGAKRWMLRTIVHGKRRDIGLGGLSLVSLAEAREEALRLRKMARTGGDPLADKRKAKTLTFKQAAQRVHETHKPSWKNPKHAQQWINTLTEYAFPVFGNRRVDQIDTPDVLRALTPIWLDKPETARRVRQRIRAVFDWAKAAGLRTGDNPVEGVGNVLPKQGDKDEHHAALPYDHVPAFLESLRKSDAGLSARLAFEFLILTAARMGEVIGATWREIDFDKATWTIPAHRMKAENEHRVPLSQACVEILRQAKELEGTHIFPGRTADKPLSNMVFLMLLRRMKLKGKVTPHGFRSTFRDWAAERTNFSREVCEMALAHVIENKVEAAYRRGDLFEKRRELMAMWAKFATATPGQVIAIRAQQRMA